MKKIVNLFERIQPTPRSIPLFLLAICGLSFGIMAPFLGFYQDDWHFIFYFLTRGTPGLIELFYYDGHPLSSWIYILSFWLLGVNPIAWQLFSIFWRWLASVLIWKLLHQLWPNHLRQTFIATIFFLLYPAYILQSQSIVYFEVWISYIFLILSFYFVGEGLRKNHLGYHLLGFAAKLVHLFTSAYITGLEFVRPVIIWYQLPNEAGITFKQKALKVLKLWLPYLLINLGNLIWRVFIYNSPAAMRADPIMISALLVDPLHTVQVLAQHLLPDLVLMLGTSWYSLLSPDLFDYSRRINLLFLGVILLGLGFIWLSLRKISVERANGAANLPPNALIIGGLITLFGLTPYYAVGYFMHVKFAPWNGRIALGSLIGIGLLTSILIHALITSPKKQNLFLAVLVALSIGWQVRSADEFRISWKKQRNLYQQLIWRVPNIKPATAFLSEQESLPLMGDYPTGFLLNTLYGEPVSPSEKRLPTWFFTTAGDFWGKEKRLAEGIPISDEKQSVHFDGQSQQSLVIHFEPEQNQCLWVLRPRDAVSSQLSSTEQLIAPLSDVNRILDTNPTAFAKELGLREKSDSWCYFYTKADLASQFHRWDEVIELWEKAQEIGQKPGNGFEYTPFIEAFAQTGDWAKAKELTLSANRANRAMNWQLCPLWNGFRTETPDTPKKDDSIREARLLLKCAKP